MAAAPAVELTHICIWYILKPTGLLVLKPDRAVFEDLQTKAKSKELASYDGGDTGTRMA